MDPNVKSANESIAMETHDTTENSAAKPVISSPDIKTRVIKQLEYYFSDVNLPYDKFLLNLTKVDDGWVKVSSLMTFKRLLSITTDKTVVMSAVKNASSTILEVDEINEKIRRKPNHALPVVGKKLMGDMIDRSVYCKGFPETATIQELLEFAATFGDNIMRVILRKDKTQKFKGSAYFMFNTKEQANIFINLESVQYNNIELERKWEKEFLEEKRAQHAKKLAKRLQKEKAVIAKYFKTGFLMKADFGQKPVNVGNVKRLCLSLNWQVSYVKVVEEQKQVWIRFKAITSAKDLLKKIGNKKNNLEILFSLPSEEEEHKVLLDMALGMKNATKIKKGFENNKKKRRTE